MDSDHKLVNSFNLFNIRDVLRFEVLGRVNLFKFKWIEHWAMVNGPLKIQLLFKNLEFGFFFYYFCKTVPSIAASNLYSFS